VGYRPKLLSLEAVSNSSNFQKKNTKISKFKRSSAVLTCWQIINCLSLRIWNHPSNDFEHLSTHDPECPSNSYWRIFSCSDLDSTRWQWWIPARSCCFGDRKIVRFGVGHCWGIPGKAPYIFERRLPLWKTTSPNIKLNVRLSVFITWDHDHAPPNACCSARCGN